MADPHESLKAMEVALSEKYDADKAINAAKVKGKRAVRYVARVLKQTGIVVRDYLVENEVEPDTRVVLPSIKKLWHPDIPEYLRLEGWNIFTHESSQSGTMFREINKKSISIVEKDSVVLSTDGEFYTYFREEPVGPLPRRVDPSRFIINVSLISPERDSLYGDGRLLVEALGQLVTQTETVS